MISVWSVPNGKLLHEFATADEAVWSLSFSSDNNILVVGADAGVLRYSLLEDQWIDNLFTTEGQLTRMELSSDDTKVLVSESTGHIRLINLFTGELLLELSADNDVIRSIAISPDGNTLAAASGGESVMLFSVSNGKRLARLTGHIGGATNVGFLLMEKLWSPHTVKAGCTGGIAPVRVG